MQGYLVGGRVRSLFTKEFIPNNADYDVVVVGTDYKTLLQYLLHNNVDIKVPNAKYIDAILNDEFTFDKFFTKDDANWTSFKTGVIKVNVKGTKSTADYVLARKAEQYEGNNLVPTGIIITPQVTLDEDISRRDFKINSLTLPLHNLIDVTSYDINELYDPYHAYEDDILNKRITCVGNPYIRFMEDPSRILRLLKFMLRLDFDYSYSIKIALTVYTKELTEAFKVKMNHDRTVQELKHIFNNKYNSYKSMKLFLEVIPAELAQVILNDNLFLNPTKIDR
jgi:tRNA nucleotidyltransferase/poly(A) polymerase